MKRKLIVTTFLSILCILGILLAFAGCQDVSTVPIPGTPAPPAESTVYTPPGAYPSSLIPTANNSYDIGTSSRQWRSLYLSQNIFTNTGTANLTLPTSTDTLVGRATTDTLTNKTLTSPTINTATVTGTVTANSSTMTSPTISSPTISGTMVNANVEMGSANITAGNAATSAISHSLGSTPTIMIATWQADPGGDGSLFISSANSTHIVIGATANSSNNCAIDYVLWIAGE